MDSTSYVVDESAAAAGAAGGLVGFIMASLAVVAVIGIAYAVLTIIARWKVFTKAGEAGWKSIIPIYNEYVEWKISWSNITLFWAYIGVGIVGAILYSMDASAAASNGGNPGILRGASSLPAFSRICRSSCSRAADRSTPAFRNRPPATPSSLPSSASQICSTVT